MDLKKLFADEEAVSPVIGVILMVAITVILAAVIASVVLGVGQEAGSTSPQASFSFDYESGATNAAYSADNNLTIIHESGDSIQSDTINIRGTGFDSTSPTNSTWAGYDDAAESTNGIDASASATVENEKGVGAGDRLEMGVDPDYEVNVVWEDPDGDSSSTLASDTGPDA